jgi:tRNA(fMet)-specific endonuclease VapC
VRLALDTNAYRAHADKNSTLIDLVQQSEKLGLPIVVLGELRFGFMNGDHLERNEQTLDRFLDDPRILVMNITVETTWIFGELATALRRQGIALAQNDIWIAALCKQYGYPLATRDRDFRHVLGLQVLEF